MGTPARGRGLRLPQRVPAADIETLGRALARQTERIRAMSADEKGRLSQALWIQARAVTAADARERQPEWTEEQVATRVQELMSDVDA